MNERSSLILHGSYKLEIFEALLDGLRSEKPVDVQEFTNLVTNAGGAQVLDLIIGASGIHFGNTKAYIGVGDSAIAPAITQTDLQGAVDNTNKLRRAMLATFPSRSGQVMTFKSTFAAADANFMWNEIGLFNSAIGLAMLSRALIASPFTKTSSLAVDATFTLTLP